MRSSNRVRVSGLRTPLGGKARVVVGVDMYAWHVSAAFRRSLTEAVCLSVYMYTRGENENDSRAVT